MEMTGVCAVLHEGCRVEGEATVHSIRVAVLDDAFDHDDDLGNVQR